MLPACWVADEHVACMQEPVVCSGHICQFEDMQVMSVLMDEIMKDPENPTDDLVLQLDIKVSIMCDS